MNRYKIPAKQTRHEIYVVNSRFIATVAPVFNFDEAKSFIRRIKEEFRDASHNVPAYIIGHGSSQLAHCHDDGEPAGTAGRPILAVLQGRGLGDTAIVVTRYFGGTKLGRGGLVRAYRDAAKAVIENVPLAKKISTYITMLSVPYSLFEQIKLLIKVHNGKIIGEEFAVDVTITCQFSTEGFKTFKNSLIEITHGKISAVIIEKNDETIVPVGSFQS